MSETMREALPIFFMFGCVLALGPFIAMAMWMAFDGDRLREPQVEALRQHADVQDREVASAPLRTAEVTSAA